MRLIDLHNDWLEQYSGETTLFKAPEAAEFSGRLRRLNGYLTDTSIAVLACSGAAADWSNQPDPWDALSERIARYEAEFSGRLLIGPREMTLYRAEPPDALTWGVLSISGFDFLVKRDFDLDRLSALHRRGIRVFQLLRGPSSALGGCDEPGDDRGLTDLGRSWLECLAKIASGASRPSRLLIDLARQNDATMAAVLDWIEADPVRYDHLIPIHSHGSGQWLVGAEPNLAVVRSFGRIASLGGLVAIDPDATAFPTPEHFKTGIERLASIFGDAANAYDSIAISTNYLGLDHVPRGLDNAERLIRWLSSTFERDIASKLIASNATRVLEHVAFINA